jgi:hypothetical protein
VDWTRLWQIRGLVHSPSDFKYDVQDRLIILKYDVQDRLIILK